MEEEGSRVRTFLKPAHSGTGADRSRAVIAPHQLFTLRPSLQFQEVSQSGGACLVLTGLSLVLDHPDPRPAQERHASAAQKSNEEIRQTGNK